MLTLAFKIADDHGLLLLDLKDLRALLQHVGDNAREFQTDYGNVSAASIGAIQRGLLTLEQQGVERFLGEPMLNVDDLIQTGRRPRAWSTSSPPTSLMQSPKVYSTLLLWLLSELYERLPEVGDPDKPKLVFFFDEAHLLFTDAPKALLDKIEQVVRLIRSKGVGVYFVTQNPLDVPDTVLGQLGNRVQHALRAFTPRDQKAVRSRRRDDARESEVRHRKRDHGSSASARRWCRSWTKRADPAWSSALYILPPASRIGPITPEERKALDRCVAGRRRLREDRRPRIGLRKAQGPRGGGTAAADVAGAAAAGRRHRWTRSRIRSAA